MNNLQNEAFIIDSILRGREQRFHEQLKILEYYKLPIISATVNYPGSVKENIDTAFLFDILLASLNKVVFKHSKVGSNSAGIYLIGCVDCDPIKIKELTVKIEKEHELGRIFDIDVIDYPYRKVSRQEINEQTRKCIMCSNDFQVCMKDNLHSKDEIMEKIHNLIAVYRKTTEQ